MTNDDSEYIKQILRSPYADVRSARNGPMFDVYLKGWKAGMKGVDEAKCPFKEKSPQRRKWIDGWNDAQCEP